MHQDLLHDAVAAHVEQQRSKAEQLCTLMQIDEELLLDYGATYWKTREDQKLD